MNIHMIIDTENDVIDVEMEHDIDESMDEDKAEFFIDLLNGIGFKIDAETESISFQGALLRKIGELQDLLEDYEGEELGFEPDEQLLAKIKEAKADTATSISNCKNVISIKSKLH
tara:strand:+ start:5740 stop:6084 length:345 start_codon:yes stop_codon:yes gene_type:complete